MIKREALGVVEAISFILTSMVSLSHCIQTTIPWSHLEL